MAVQNLFRACRSLGWAAALGTLLLTLSQVTAWAQAAAQSRIGSPATPIPVKVGGSIFMPFVELEGDGHPGAMEIDQIPDGMKRGGSLDRFLTKVGLRSEE